MVTRQLSRHLLALFMEKNPVGEELMNRMLVSTLVTHCHECHHSLWHAQPAGLLSAMKSDEKVPEVDIDRMHTRDNLKAAKVELGRQRKGLGLWLNKPGG